MFPYNTFWLTHATPLSYDAPFQLAAYFKDLYVAIGLLLWQDLKYCHLKCFAVDLLVFPSPKTDGFCVMFIYVL